LGVPPIKPMTGAQFEILIDATPRTYRDQKAIAIEAAENLKRKYPYSAVMVKDLQSCEVTAAVYKPDLRCGGQAQSMSPNFVLLDSSNSEIASLITAMLQARAVERRSWSHPAEPVTEQW
jgi:hypothetical protein